MGKRSKTLGDFFYESWAEEQEACVSYVEGSLGENDKPPTPKELGVACVYEYFREGAFAFSEKNGNDLTKLKRLFEKDPFAYFPHFSSLTWKQFCGRPWTKVSLQDRAKLSQPYLYSYSGEDTHPIPIVRLQTNDENGTFEKFKQQAKNNRKEFSRAYKKRDIEKMTALYAALSILDHGPGVEQVLLLVDYHQKKQALLKNFKAWLDSRNEMFEKYSVELTGTRFYRERLRDLGFWRLHRRLSKDDLAQLESHKEWPILERTYAEAAQRAVKFTKYLISQRHADLRDVEQGFSTCR
jgi:hypothetical protein